MRSWSWKSLLSLILASMLAGAALAGSIERAHYRVQVAELKRDLAIARADLEAARVTAVAAQAATEYCLTQYRELSASIDAAIPGMRRVFERCGLEVPEVWKSTGTTVPASAAVRSDGEPGGKPCP